MDMLNFSSPQSKECEDMLSIVLEQFRKQYPSSTSGDIQTFIIGFRAGWVYYKDNPTFTFKTSNEQNIQEFKPIEHKNLISPS